MLPFTPRPLPSKWDGRAVKWDEWSEGLPIFVCPPPRERSVCPACGSVEPRVTAVGSIAHKRRTTVDDIENYARGGLLGKVALRTLTAFRCVDCRHDQVWDMDRDELWDLDDSDYGDDGSVHPNGLGILR